jgi:hypothetical protein
MRPTAQEQRLEQAEERRMIRTTEHIQQDIRQIASEIQELRRTQKPTRDSDRSDIARRIYQLTARLDALYAEKRALSAPAPSTKRPDTEKGNQRTAAAELVAQLFRTQPTGD